MYKYILIVFLFFTCISQVTTKPILIYPNSGESYDGDRKEWVVSTSQTFCFLTVPIDSHWISLLILIDLQNNYVFIPSQWFVGKKLYHLLSCRKHGAETHKPWWVSFSLLWMLSYLRSISLKNATFIFTFRLYTY